MNLGGILKKVIQITLFTAILMLPAKAQITLQKSDREPSFISLPVEIPIELVNKKINDKMGYVLYSDESYTRPTADDLKLKVYKNAAITTTGSGDVLNFKIPLKIWAQARWQACSVCPELERQTIFDIDVFLRSKVEVTKDYAFRLTTSSDGFEWKKKPEVSIGPVDINISRVVEKSINDQLKEIARDIDRQVNTAMDLKSQVQNIWNMSEDVYLIDDTTQTWLRLEPKSVYLTPINCDNQNIKLTLGIESFIDTYIGEKPKENLKTRLPDLIVSASQARTIAINAVTELPFTEATRIAKIACNGLSFGEGKKKTTIRDISISGKDDLASIWVMLDGKFKGKVTILGKPVYNSETNQLSFENLQFDLESKNLLMKAAKWLASESVAKKLQQQLVFSYKNEVEGLKSDFDQRLSDYRFRDWFVMKGKLNDFKVKKVSVDESRFLILLKAEGKASLTLTNLAF